MEFAVGNRIRYVFPQSSNTQAKVFVGIIEFVGDTFFMVRDTNKVILKISFKNFDKAEVIEPLDKTHLYVSHPI